MQRSTRLVRQKSFGIRIVSVWNNLPEHVINSQNVNTFKSRLDKRWENQDIIFNYRAEITSDGNMEEQKKNKK